MVPVVKAGNTTTHLSVNEAVYVALKGFVAGNPRKGRKTVSEVTDQLWISYLRKKGVKLPPLFKPERNGRAAK